ncbi:hypothetical protein ACIHFE_29235 [Streptomyces sp. NPDC052396]|uniref:hypothetical protein n=1 Tax=Streptomyces sp. NPDC052396 TaxID=3365689 RepID=UPI0037D915C2
MTGIATALAVCAGAGCRGRAAEGGARGLTAAGSRLCAACGDRLVRELSRLPRLHEECGLRLGGGPDQRQEKTSGGPLPGMPFNSAAAEARSAIMGVLRCWAAVVVEDRGVAAPENTVSALGEFLIRHAGWLAAQDAAHEVSLEIAKLVNRAYRVIDPLPIRRVPIGGCVEAGCPGTLTALLRPHRPDSQAEIVCDTAPGHRWQAADWLRLRRRLAQGNSTAEAPAAAWVSAGHIARLWRIPPGSVYRHASEQRWRRRTRAGRTYYHDGDVRRTLDGRG